jgi:tyrosyl-tRNA synthetase
MNESQIFDVVERGVENVVPGKDELKKLIVSGKKLNVYLGIDPTATRIHLGHAFPLRKLQILAEAGHNVTFLIGDFTAIVGDTSDKNTERPDLTREQIEENFQNYKAQAEKVLDFSRVTVHYNSEWLSKLSFGDVLQLTSHFSVNDFVGRELIRNRLTEGKRVSLPEVLYPIMQGYDSYFMDTDIQFGGTDQIFNMQAGRTLQKALRNRESFVVANGFLLGTDGRKMSKSWGNAIWLNDPAEELYGKVMSIKDELIIEYFVLGTVVPMKEIGEFEGRLKSGENPMNIKKVLAARIVEELCGHEAIGIAEEHFRQAVVDKQATDDVAVVEVADKLNMSQLLDLIVNNGLIESRSKVKDLLLQGGVYLNENRVPERFEILELNSGENVLRVGKRRYLKLKVE